MSEEMIAGNFPFWVTRMRHETRPQLPYPDAMDEWLDGEPTGRMQIIRGSGKFIGTLEQVDEWVRGFEMSKAMVQDKDGWRENFSTGGRSMSREARRKINNGTAHKPHTSKEQEITHSGLTRNPNNEQTLRDMIEKFRVGGSLSDLELRFLIQYYGIMVRMCEISGDIFFLPRQNAMLNYNKLLGIAKERGWTQSLINMYGTIIESVFERIL
jgi:hypothetical protein